MQRDVVHPGLELRGRRQLAEQDQIGRLEVRALFGQLLDSDSGDGNTDTNGYVLRGGYTVARNWTLNAALFLNKLSNDVPQAVTVFNDATAAPYDMRVINGVIDRDYKRMQLDLNFRF